MRKLFTFILLIVCVIIGYLIHPIIVKNSTNTPAVAEDSEAEKEKLNLLYESVIKELTTEDYPKVVSLKKNLIMYDSNSDHEINLKKGLDIKPLRIDGKQIVFQLVDQPIQSKVLITDTNFIELSSLLIELRKSKEKSEDIARTESTQNMPINDSKNIKRQPVSENPANIKAEKISIPEETKAQVVSSDKDTNIQIDESAAIELVKANISAGGVKEFKMSQVSGHNFNDNYNYDGKIYQSVLVKFTAETILGAQEHEALALISNGKISSWIWAKTGLEME